MSEIKNLFANGNVEKYSKGDVIVNAFDEPSGMYLIERGFVQSYSISEQGNTNIQLIRSVGDVFPLLWGVGEITRDIYFSAMDDVVVRRLSLADFQSSVKNNHKLNEEVQKQLVEVYLLLAERVRNLEQRRVKDRVLYCLNSLAERFGQDKQGMIVINAPIHHHDIADMINASREATSREFVLLEKESAVGYENKKIVVYAHA